MEVGDRQREEQKKEEVQEEQPRRSRARKRRWAAAALVLLLAAGIGAIWFATFKWQLGKMPLLPLHDTRFEGVLEHEHGD